MTYIRPTETKLNPVIKQGGSLQIRGRTHGATDHNLIQQEISETMPRPQE